MNAKFAASVVASWDHRAPTDFDLSESLSTMDDVRCAPRANESARRAFVAETMQD